MQSKIGCYIIAVAVITVWSTTFVSTKILLRSLSPEEIMFYRHVLHMIRNGNKLMMKARATFMGLYATR